MGLSFGRIIAAGVLILVTHLLYILFFGADIFEVAGMVANNYMPPKDPNPSFWQPIIYVIKTYLPFSVFAFPVYWLIGTKLIPVLRAGDLDILGFEQWLGIVAVPFLVPPFIFLGLAIPFEVFHKNMGFSANAYMMAPFYASFATLVAFVAFFFGANKQRQEAYQKIAEQNRQNAENAQAAKRQSDLDREAQRLRQNMEIDVEGHKRKTEISLAAAEQMEATRMQYKAILDELRDERDQKRQEDLRRSADFYREELERLQKMLDQ